jgi:hypothetical protein
MFIGSAVKRKRTTKVPPYNNPSWNRVSYNLLYENKSKNGKRKSDIINYKERL